MIFQYGEAMTLIEFIERHALFFGFITTILVFSIADRISRE